MSQDDKLNPFSTIPHLERINQCIQCGTCSGSCPLSDLMDHAPRLPVIYFTQLAGLVLGLAPADLGLNKPCL